MNSKEKYTGKVISHTGTQVFVADDTCGPTDAEPFAHIHPEPANWTRLYKGETVTVKLDRFGKYNIHHH